MNKLLFKLAMCLNRKIVLISNNNKYSSSYWKGSNEPFTNEDTYKQNK